MFIAPVLRRMGLLLQLPTMRLRQGTKRVERRRPRVVDRRAEPRGPTSFGDTDEGEPTWADAEWQ